MKQHINLCDFYNRLISLLNNIKEIYDLNDIHDAFIVWFSENKYNISTEDVIERIVHDSHAEGIDAVLVDQNNYTLYFLSANTVEKYNNTRKNLSETDIKSTLGGIRLLLTDNYKGIITPELENLINEYHELVNRGIYETKIIFLTMNKEPVDYKFIDLFLKDYPKVKIEIFDFNKIFDFYNNEYLSLTKPPPEKILLEILYQQYIIKDQPHKSIIFSCSGKEIAKAYDMYKESLFQLNLRNPLGINLSINEKIFNTAIDDISSKYFWFYNNGITMICKKILENPTKKTITLESPQIINGAQTTHAIYTAFNDGKLNDKVEILIKAIESTDKIFIENVTLFTNSQNAIRLRDLSSNDEIQKKIQRILLGTYKYYFQRKRGEFELDYTTIEAKKKTFGSDFKDRIIDNEIAAQAFLSLYLNKPVEAKRDKWKIFLKDANGGFYDSIFQKNCENLCECLLFAWKLIKYIKYQNREYKLLYKRADTLSDPEKRETYKHDFILYADYFIINFFNIYLLKEVNNLEENINLLKLIDMINKNDIKLKEIYNDIINRMSEYINNKKKDPRFYLNKFFKDEKAFIILKEYIYNQS